MLKRPLTFTLAALISSCGPLMPKSDNVKTPGQNTRLHQSSNPVFSSYVSAFEQEGRVHLNDNNFTAGDVPINFGDTKNTNYDAVCNTYSDSSKEILVDQNWWNSTNETQREIIIFHELGHCRLGRDHDNELYTNTIGETRKISVMNGTIPDSQTYQIYREGYLEELFTYSRGTLLSEFE